MGIFLNFFLTSPLNQSAVKFCQYQLLHTSQILPTAITIVTACPFVVSLLCLDFQTFLWPFLLQLWPSPSLNHKSDLIVLLPKRFHGYYLLSGESSDESTEEWSDLLLAVQPVSCFSTRPTHTLSGQLLAVLHMCVTSLLPLCLQFFERAVPIACVSHYLLFTPFLPGSYSTYNTSLLWGCFFNLLSSPGLI